MPYLSGAANIFLSIEPFHFGQDLGDQAFGLGEDFCVAFTDRAENKF